MAPLPDRIAASPVGWIARLRGARALHPAGVACNGYASIGDDVLPLRSGTVGLRISKGLGTPGGLPDLVGVAVRMQTPPAPGTDPAPAPDPGNDSPRPADTGEWDLLLTGPVRPAGGILLPHPARSWTDVLVSTLSRFRYRGRDWRIDGRLLTAHGPGGLDVGALTARLAESGGVLALSVQHGSDGPRPLGVVNFAPRRTGRDIAFDPVRTTPASVTPVPRWLAGLRRSTYDASRRARPS